MQRKISVVQNNLNTPPISSFYEHLAADEAKAPAKRFWLHYTPKGASWLNMTEIEFSVLSKRYLNRTTGTKRQLAKQVNAIIEERNDKQININRQFSIQTARQKLNNRCTTVHMANAKLKKTWLIVY